MHAHLIFPNQLFEQLADLADIDLFILVEDDLFFKQFPFHKQKLILHRASMRQLANTLEPSGAKVVYIETDSETTSIENLKLLLNKHAVTNISHYDVVDDWLERRLKELTASLKVPREIYSSPSFLTTNGQLHDFFYDKQPRMNVFYKWQRQRLGIMVDKAGQPVGGKWSFDESNRKSLPKNVLPPPPYQLEDNQAAQDAIEWVKQAFPNNPGNADTFTYPTTHSEARRWLTQFLKDRFADFGPYEDAIVEHESQLFHSVLSPLINTGLLLPGEVVQAALKHSQNNDVSIESLEGFIRQVIGWREYMRATYVLNGRGMRTQNFMKLDRKLDQSWWTGETGLQPIDATIKKVLDTAYAHHIERLMVLGNSMLLLRFDPDEVYTWFMSLFIDAYDWVMVPNVYGMSQYSAADKIVTKPYVSGSNYIRKMSDYKTGDWTAVWDALYWQFINDYRTLFAGNYRSSMMVHLYDRMSDERKNEISKIAGQWLNS